MTGYDAAGISVMDFRKFAQDGRLSLRNDQYLFDNGGDLYYCDGKSNYLLIRLPKSLQTDIMLRIKYIYLIETNAKHRNY